MRNLLRRIKHWFRAGRLQDELAEEFETHRAMTQDRLERSGLSTTEAKYASRRALGNVTLAREDARRVWIWPWLDSARQDGAYALRTIRRHPGFAAAFILITSLGIAATTSVFGLLDALVLKPLPVREPERLVWFRSPSFSYPIYSQVRARGTEIFSAFFAWNLESVHIDWNGELEPAEVLMATGDFYSTLGIQPAAGRFFGPDDDQIGGGRDGPVAVISHACWLSRFAGDRGVIGRTVRIDRQAFTIVGVAPRGFFGVAAGLAPEVTIPLLPLQDADQLGSPTSAWLHMMGRLRDGLTLEQANNTLQGFWPSALEVTTNPGMPADRRAMYLGRRTALEPGSAGFSRVRNQFAEPLWLLLALVGVLFTVASASGANLLLARGVARQRELAVRMAIGASRPRLVRQLLAESLVWTALSTFVAITCAPWISGALVAMMRTREDPVTLTVSPDWRVLGFALTLTLLTVIICSVLPAFRVTRVAPAPSLKETGQTSTTILRRWSFGKALVVSQVALAVVLLIGAALFIRSLTGILSQDAGFDRDNVLVVATDAEAAGYQDERLNAFYVQLQDRLAAIPGVASTSLSRYPPISDSDGSWTQSIVVDGGPLEAESSRYVYFNPISPGYFVTVGMRLLHGRDFSHLDNASSQKVVIVNESLARRFFQDQNPIGRQIGIGRDAKRQNLEIVGVVSDAKYQTLKEPARRIAYFPVAQQGLDRNLYAEVRAAVPASSIVDSIRREVRALDGRVPLRIESVTDRIRESLVTERVIATLASALGLVALVLACTGLYGLLAYAVSRQTNEIGLRLALGADRTRVVWMILRECVSLAAIGVLLGVSVSLALGRFARTLLHEISPTDALSLVAAAIIMLLVAILAGLLPARQAARVDPAVALRNS
jgi:putative ABC transport system permease protein